MLNSNISSQLPVDYGLCIKDVREGYPPVQVVHNADVSNSYQLLSEVYDRDSVEEKNGKLREGYDRWNLGVIDHETGRESGLVVDVLTVGGTIIDVMFADGKVRDHIDNLVDMWEVMTELDHNSSEHKAEISQYKRLLGHRRKRKDSLGCWVDFFFGWLTKQLREGNVATDEKVIRKAEKVVIDAQERWKNK